MEIGQGPNWACSAKGKKKEQRNAKPNDVREYGKENRCACAGLTDWLKMRYRVHIELQSRRCSITSGHR
jgi:hypothetical protein